MFTNENVLLIVSMTFAMNSFVLGYFLGRLNHSSQTISDSPRSFFKQQSTDTNTVTKINIDDTKFVGSINTDYMEKKYNSLGETKQSSENISGAINKLKNMKG